MRTLSQISKSAGLILVICMMFVTNILAQGAGFTTRPDQVINGQVGDPVTIQMVALIAPSPNAIAYQGTIVYDPTVLTFVSADAIGHNLHPSPGIVSVLSDAVTVPGEIFFSVTNSNLSSFAGLPGGLLANFNFTVANSGTFVANIVQMTEVIAPNNLVDITANCTGGNITVNVMDVGTLTWCNGSYLDAALRSTRIYAEDAVTPGTIDFMLTPVPYIVNAVGQFTYSTNWFGVVAQRDNLLASNQNTAIINSTDWLRAFDVMSGQAVPTTRDNYYGDVNLNGIIDAGDITIIRRAGAGVTLPTIAGTVASNNPFVFVADPCNTPTFPNARTNQGSFVTPTSPLVLRATYMGNIAGAHIDATTGALYKTSSVGTLVFALDEKENNVKVYWEGPITRHVTFQIKNCGTNISVVRTGSGFESESIMLPQNIFRAMVIAPNASRSLGTSKTDPILILNIPPTGSGPLCEQVEFSGITNPNLGDIDYPINYRQEVIGATSRSSRVEVQSNLYPNPTTGNVSIAFEDERLVGGTLQITNLLGQVVFESTIVEKDINLDLKGNAPGIYLVEARGQNNDIVSNSKVVLQ